MSPPRRYRSMRASLDSLHDVLSSLERADVAAGLRIGRRRKHPLIRATGAVSELGDQPPLLVLSGALMLYGVFARDPRALEAGGRAFVAIAAASAIKTLVKNSVTRSRPNVVLGGELYRAHYGRPEHGRMQSFPSGHTAGSVAAARALTRAYPNAAAPAYGAAAFVAGAQLPRAAHYPGDVITGVAIGLAAEALVAAFWPARRASLKPASADEAPLRRSGSRRSPLSPATREGRA
jgi:membrane-associated phospholipid phosphatase